MKTKEKLNVQIVKTAFTPVIKLWVRKDRKIAQDTFQIIHKYEHYYLLQNSKGIKVCAKFQEMKSNSKYEPMILY